MDNGEDEMWKSFLFTLIAWFKITFTVCVIFVFFTSGFVGVLNEFHPILLILYILSFMI